MLPGQQGCRAADKGGGGWGRILLGSVGGKTFVRCSASKNQLNYLKSAELFEISLPNSLSVSVNFDAKVTRTKVPFMS